MKSPRAVTRDEIRDVDRIAVEKYHMPGIVLMENAARGAAEHIVEALASKVEGRHVTIACGGGNNGGDGFAIARHLHNAGADVTILLTTEPEKLKGDAETNYRIAMAMGLPMAPCASPDQVQHATTLLMRSDCIVDALLGTGFRGEVRSPMKELVEEINTAGRHGIKVVAVDVPSGLDCQTGESGGAVRASLTVTFAAPKVGFFANGAERYVGHLAVVDIGVPREIVPREQG
jgi:NAD(P)H-hydrate epimerase